MDIIAQIEELRLEINGLASTNEIRQAKRQLASLLCKLARTEREA